MFVFFDQRISFRLWNYAKYYINKYVARWVPPFYQKFPSLPGASMMSAWCEADIRLSEELTTEGYRQEQEGPRV